MLTLYIQNAEFLNQKHRRDSNQDIEVIIEGKAQLKSLSS